MSSTAASTQFIFAVLIQLAYIPDLLPLTYT